jgi:hypothetical protein
MVESVPAASILKMVPLPDGAVVLGAGLGRVAQDGGDQRGCRQRK